VWTGLYSHLTWFYNFYNASYLQYLTQIGLKILLFCSEVNGLAELADMLYADINDISSCDSIAVIINNLAGEKYIVTGTLSIKHMLIRKDHVFHYTTNKSTIA